MKFKILSVIALFSGALAAQTAPLPSKAAAESNRAESLMREIRANAARIQSSAGEIEALEKTQHAKWEDYDRQWNVIKPLQERIDVALRRLEGMQASLSPAERKALEQTRRDAQEIANSTRDLWIKLSEPMADLKPAVST